jgi:uncharacterized membrane protein YdcZ (DUF606 family)
VKRNGRPFFARIPSGPRRHPDESIIAPALTVSYAGVTSVFLALPVIGAAATVGFTIAGQQVVAILTDRFGLFGLPKSAVSGVRLAGALVLLAGVVSIKLP